VTEEEVLHNGQRGQEGLGLASGSLFRCGVASSLPYIWGFENSGVKIVSVCHYRNWVEVTPRLPDFMAKDGTF
jgi:hypothetical protein